MTAIQLPVCSFLKNLWAFANQAICISFLSVKYSRYTNELKLDRNPIVLAVSLVKIMILEKKVLIHSYKSWLDVTHW